MDAVTEAGRRKEADDDASACCPGDLCQPGVVLVPLLLPPPSCCVHLFHCNTAAAKLHLCLSNVASVWEAEDQSIDSPHQPTPPGHYPGLQALLKVSFATSSHSISFYGSRD